MFGRKKQPVAAPAEATQQPAPGQMPPPPPEAAPEAASLQQQQPQPDAPALDDQTKARNALGAKLVSAAFGEMTALLMRTPSYKHHALADLEWLLVPPLLLNQFSLAEARSKENGFSAPLGFALWARLSDELDARMKADPGATLRLKPEDWNSGPHLWLIEAVGPANIVKALITRLAQNQFKGQSFMIRTRDQAGRPAVQKIEPQNDSQQQSG